MHRSSNAARLSPRAANGHLNRNAVLDRSEQKLACELRTPQVLSETDVPVLTSSCHVALPPGSRARIADSPYVRRLGSLRAVSMRASGRSMECSRNEARIQSSYSFRDGLRTVPYFRYTRATTEARV